MEELPPVLAKSRAREIAERLKLISGGRVLDVCTGSGDFIRTLMRTLGNFTSFIGVDKSKRIWNLDEKSSKANPSNSEKWMRSFSILRIVHSRANPLRVSLAIFGYSFDK
jgi:methylase of polypeptide subunit release factors